MTADTCWKTTGGQVLYVTYYKDHLIHEGLYDLQLRGERIGILITQSSQALSGSKYLRQSYPKADVLESRTLMHHGSLHCATKNRAQGIGNTVATLTFWHNIL